MNTARITSMIETKHNPEFEIIRNHRRKRIAIRVWEGKVQLLTPQRFKENEAIAFLDKHAGWIQKKLHEQKSTHPYHPKQYIDGELFPYLGENYFLNIACAKKPTVMVRGNQLFVFIRETTCPNKRKLQIHQQLRAWYWQQAEQQLQQKSYEYAQRLGVQYQSITIKQFKSRWGSCSIKGDIQYTWQIILAPHAIVDYLTVHELAHIKHHDHSSQFWQVVESIIPDYKICRNWLRTQGHQLRIE